MDNRKVIYKLAIAFATTALFIGCKPKYSEIDNNQVISKPYVLYVADSFGAIQKTNDGLSFDHTFAPDNYPAFAMVTASGNLLFAKKNLHYIQNVHNGINNSNPTLTLPAGPVGYDRSMMISIPKWHNRVYVGGIGTKGLMSNDSLGTPGIGSINWKSVTDANIASGGVISSFTFLDENRLIAYDDTKKYFYSLTDEGGTFAAPATGGGLNTAKRYIVSHIANTVLAACLDTAIVYYSSDYGATFKAYDGLPGTATITTIEAPFNQTILVGTKAHGIFRLPLGSTQFVQSSLGLPALSKVSCITSKYDYFKNSNTKQYTYASTNKGLYRSESNGENWYKVLDGNFVTLY
jgi:hypothetical protein